jgi:hypothetical protein
MYDTNPPAAANNTSCQLKLAKTVAEDKADDKAVNPAVIPDTINPRQKSRLFNFKNPDFFILITFG